MTKQEHKKNAARNTYLTPTECAQRLNIATVTLRKWAQQGMLEAVVTPGGTPSLLCGGRGGICQKIQSAV